MAQCGDMRRRNLAHAPGVFCVGRCFCGRYCGGSRRPRQEAAVSVQCESHTVWTLSSSRLGLSVVFLFFLLADRLDTGANWLCSRIPLITPPAPTAQTRSRGRPPRHQPALLKPRLHAADLAPPVEVAEMEKVHELHAPFLLVREACPDAACASPAPLLCHG